MKRAGSSDRRRSRRAYGIERNEARRIASFRLVRTVLLGTVAMVAAFYWIGQQYGVDPEVMRGYILTTLLFVGVLVGLGLLGAVLLLAVKRFTQGRGKNGRL